MLGSNLNSEASKNSELFPLSKNYQLYLKPLARVSLTVQIPTLHDASGQTKSFTTWGIIEKLRQLCPGVLSPPTPIKVVRTTLEFVRFIAELQTKAEVKRVVTSLDSQFIKLSGFPQNLRVRASEAQPDCPRRHDWESFFRDAADMDETQPGERPDTLVLTGLPVRWFINISSKASCNDGDNASSELKLTKSDWPCPNVVRDVFEIFGPVRAVDIPIIDPVQNPNYVDEFMEEICGSKIKASQVFRPLTPGAIAVPDSDTMLNQSEVGGFGKIGPDTISVMGKINEVSLTKTRKSSISGLLDSGSIGDSKSHSGTPSVGSLTFVAYIQYKDYTGFARAMEGLRGQKLVYAPTSSETNTSDMQSNKLFFTAEIKVDFDRSKHLSRSAILSRQTERNRLVILAQRRRTEAEAEAAQEARQQQMLEDAKRKEEERRRVEALAHQAEREMRRFARAERKRQKAIERCRQEKEYLIKQKIMLDERRRLLATRKIEAIRLMTFLVKRIQFRHDAIVTAKREARLARAERQAAEAEALLMKNSAPANSSFADHHRSVERYHSPSPGGCSDDTTSETVDAKELRERLLMKMLKRREKILRATLLKKHSKIAPHRTSVRRPSNEVSSSVMISCARSPHRPRSHSRELDSI